MYIELTRPRLNGGEEDEATFHGALCSTCGARQHRGNPSSAERSRRQALHIDGRYASDIEPCVFRIRDV